MQSIISYEDRGNCSGYVIRDLIKQFYPNSKPKKFIEIFSRWRYWKRCCH